MARKTLTPCDTQLSIWNDSRIVPLGKCTLVVRNCKTNKKFSVELIVVEQDFKPILGKRASEKMKLITFNNSNIFSVNDVLSSVAVNVLANRTRSLPGLVHLTTDPTHVPGAITSRRVPISLRDKVIAELGKLEQAGLITKVDKPIDSVNRNVVGTKKSGDLRICIDP